VSKKCLIFVAGALTSCAVFYVSSFFEQPDKIASDHTSQQISTSSETGVTGVVTDLERYIDPYGQLQHTVSINNVVFPITELQYPDFRVGETVTVYKGLFFGHR